MSKYTDVIIRYRGEVLLPWLAANYPERLNEDQTAVLGLTRIAAEAVVIEGVTWLWQFARVHQRDLAFWRDTVAGDAATSLEIVGSCDRVQGQSDAVYRKICDQGTAEGATARQIATLDLLKLLTLEDPRPIYDEETGEITGYDETLRYKRPCYM